MATLPAAKPRIPTATYRVQLHEGFTFDQARAIIPYLHELGISDLYTSPFFQASAGSTHGYDIVDHNKLNPEIGTEAEFEALVAELHRHGMGLVADFVPNHMGISEAANGWWMDVLENGPSSLMARCFDIDWHPLKQELDNKVLLPILGDQYGKVLEKGELGLRFEAGVFSLHYYGARLPINPRTYNLILQVALDELAPAMAAAAVPTGVGPLDAAGAGGARYHLAELQSIMTQLEKMPARTVTDRAQIAERAREKEVAKVRLEQLCAEHADVAAAIQRAVEILGGKPGDARSFDRLDALIDAQAYRLSYWRVAAEEINYRRFFDINTLAAIRVELPEVFEATHQLLWRLLERGAVTGLRIDHPDGLYDPRGYFAQLQQNFARLTGTALPADRRGVYLLAEKILSPGEVLREDWPIHGTTGYDFTTQVTQLLIDASNEKAFSQTYQKFLDRNVHFPTLVYEKKRLTMRLSLANDINVLGFMLNRLSEHNRLVRDFTLNALTSVVREVIACFPVYRTYLVPGQAPGPADRAVINRAVALAKRQNPGTETSIFNFLRDILLFHFPPNTDPAGIAEHEAFVMKFQQCTGPIMAKGLEDTAFYIYNRLVALNEVGGEPQRFGITPAEFHAYNSHNAAHWPHTMLASSTHDTKRAEDTRARIAGLSELPTEWRQALRSWSTLNRKHRGDVDGEPAPAPNEEYLLYQILLGTWPAGFASLPDDEHAAYQKRIQDYMTKAIKEAKVNSSWVQPNEPWDEAVRKFIERILRRGSRRDAFARSIEPLAARLAQLGLVNSLAQTVLKLTVPGVPDIYQGNGLWDFSLVDPDNRRPVDYAKHRAALESLAGANPRALLENWGDGRIKLFVTRAILRQRAEQPALFAQGAYRPLPTIGTFTENAVAFVREWESAAALVIVPRLSARVGFPPIGDCWADTGIALPEGGEIAGPWRELLTGREIAAPSAGNLPLAEALRDLPVAVLVR
jgi:(1->4)-alpha-D-glucan 1-alpha-D-glucosylmutase